MVNECLEVDENGNSFMKEEFMMIDLGLARVQCPANLKGVARDSTRLGDRKHLPPEAWGHNQRLGDTATYNSNRADVYSLGKMISTLVFGSAGDFWSQCAPEHG